MEVDSRTKEKEIYIALLRQKAEELGRLPRKSDFPNEDMAKMKAYWGPWPRVLESAQLLLSKEPERQMKKQARKERRNRTEDAV